MGSVRIGMGTAWLADGRTWRVVRQLDAERLDAGRTLAATDAHWFLERLVQEVEVNCAATAWSPDTPC